MLRVAPVMIALLSACVVLPGCGQTGALYLPSENQPASEPEQDDAENNEKADDAGP